MSREAVLIHGTASTSTMWIKAGWPELLSELGISSTLFALPGHRESQLDADADESDIHLALSDAAPEADIIIGFSAGALLALRAAVAMPMRYRHVILLGLGDGMWGPARKRTAFAQELLVGKTSHARMMQSIARSSDNDLESVSKFIAADPGPPPLENLACLVAKVMIVIGSDDPLGPADNVAQSIPHAVVRVIAGVDHDRTPTTAGAMTAAIDFLSPKT